MVPGAWRKKAMLRILIYLPPGGPVRAHNWGLMPPRENSFFRDADIEVSPNAVDQISAVLHRRPGLAADFGCILTDILQPIFYHQ